MFIYQANSYVAIYINREYNYIIAIYTTSKEIPLIHTNAINN